MTKDTDKPMMEKIPIDIDSIVKLAIFLEGYKLGRGNLSPLGTITIENLWNTIAFLRGDVRYYNPEKS